MAGRQLQQKTETNLRHHSIVDQQDSSLPDPFVNDNLDNDICQILKVAERISKLDCIELAPSACRLTFAFEHIGSATHKRQGRPYFLSGIVSSEEAIQCCSKGEMSARRNEC
jgi:hypothetical protein